jgi:hypothetical protein
VKAVSEVIEEAQPTTQPNEAVVAVSEVIDSMVDHKDLEKMIEKTKQAGNRTAIGFGTKGQSDSD